MIRKLPDFKTAKLKLVKRKFARIAQEIQAKSKKTCIMS
jgi:hypothetical protein